MRHRPSSQLKLLVKIGVYPHFAKTKRNLWMTPTILGVPGFLSFIRHPLRPAKEEEEEDRKESYSSPNMHTTMTKKSTISPKNPRTVAEKESPSMVGAPSNVSIFHEHSHPPLPDRHTTSSSSPASEQRIPPSPPSSSSFPTCNNAPRTIDAE